MTCGVLNYLFCHKPTELTELFLTFHKSQVAIAITYMAMSAKSALISTSKWGSHVSIDEGNQHIIRQIFYIAAMAA